MYDRALAISMRVPDPLLTSVAVLAGTAACLPSVQLGATTIVRQDCRGEFSTTLDARRDGVRNVELVFEVLPGQENTEDVVLTPQRTRLDRKHDSALIRMDARLEDACKDGGVPLLASYAPGGTTTYLGANAIVGADPAGGSATGDGAFEYPLTVRCCGAQVAGEFAVAVTGGANTRDVVVAPTEFACIGVETRHLTVRGSLADSRLPAEVGLSVTHLGADVSCELSDTVRPAAQGVPDGGPGEGPS